MNATNQLLSVNDLAVTFALKTDFPWQKTPYLTAVNNVSFHLNKGETLAIVGESGCGKSTLARALIGLTPVSAGHIIWQQQDITNYNLKQHQTLCKERQMIFQDPLNSLNPRIPVGEIIAEPLRYIMPELSNAQRQERVIHIMQKVGLSAEQRLRYPHEFSGGQCQRIGIARALITQPKLLICDEPVSALDVSIQAQIINLLQTLQQEFNLSMIFITHNLCVAKHISDKILVMYLGKVMEIGNKEQIFNHPMHPYTQMLLNAVPVPDPVLERQKPPVSLTDELPSPLNPPSGCVFRTRCPYVMPRCTTTVPNLRSVNGSQQAACLLIEDGK